MRLITGWPSCPKCGLQVEKCHPSMSNGPTPATCSRCATSFKWWPFSGFMAEVTTDTKEVRK